jgi:hypothetical protein
MKHLKGCDVLADGSLQAGHMENIVYSAALWKIQLVSYDPYPFADPVRSKETWL